MKFKKIMISFCLLVIGCLAQAEQSRSFLTIFKPVTRVRGKAALAGAATAGAAYLINKYRWATKHEFDQMMNDAKYQVWLSFAQTRHSAENDLFKVENGLKNNSTGLKKLNDQFDSTLNMQRNDFDQIRKHIKTAQKNQRTYSLFSLARRLSDKLEPK